MRKRASMKYRRAGTPPPSPGVPVAERWYGKIFLLLLGVVLLTLAFAPAYQFYLAWVGLVPWLVVVRYSKSAWRAFGWSWVGGVLFFSANMWWLYKVTGPGLVALMAILGLYWSVAGFIIKGTGLLDGSWWRRSTSEVQSGEGVESPNPSLARGALLPAMAIAAIWVGVEWFRGTWPFHGLPWLYMGHTQSPALYLCQIADLTGELGISYWVVLVNAWLAFFVLNRLTLRGLGRSLAVVGGLTVLVLGYGVWRFSQFQTSTAPGPTVLVVQSNYPQSNTGDKGEKPPKIVQFHLDRTRQVLAKDPVVDLVAWSETMVPPINAEARRTVGRNGEFGQLLWATHDRIAEVAARSRAAFIVGGSYWADFQPQPASGDLYPADSRNVAYYFERSGATSDLRYDKIHLVPFGEFIPFKQSIPWLYRLLISLGPPDMQYYQLNPGSEDNLTAFPLPPRPGTGGATWHFVTPICFEDIDANLAAQMFRGPGGTKRADFLVNLTNDGWFKFNENPQHLQAAQFRSIENRAPTARSVNTGISGFIDSMGRPTNLLAQGTEGTSIATLRIDHRVTLFTRIGNVFAWICAGATWLMAITATIRWWVKRRAAVRA